MKYILTAGGTGGHIYPALAVLDEIRKNKNNEFLYIGTTNRMEAELIPSLNIPFEGIEIYGFSKKNILKNIKCFYSSYKKCLKIIDKFKPDAIIAFGNYLTIPVCLAAKKRGVKIFLHEQNKLPGKANVFLSRYADSIFVSFKDGDKSLKCNSIIYTGNPVSQRAIETKKYDKTKLGFKRNKKLIIIVMGSLGSSSVNNKLLDFLKTYQKEDREILFISGKNSYKDLNDNLKVPTSTKIVPFFDNLSSLMKDADLIISRAGASTISEILSTKIPSILIPSPYVPNNHQYYNALDLENKNLSILINEKDLNSDTLIKAIDDILDTKEYKKIKDKLNEIKDIPSSTMILKEIDKKVKDGEKKKKI